MPRRRVTALSIDDDLPVERNLLLVAMFAVSAALCVFSTLLVTGTTQARIVVAGAAAVGTGAAFGLWLTRRRRRHRLVLPGCLVLFSALVAVVALNASTVAGVLALGPAVIMACAYAGCFFTRSTLWLQIGLALSGYVTCAVLSDPLVTPIPLLTTVITALSIGVVLNKVTARLRGHSQYDSLTGVVSRGTWLQIATGSLHRAAARPVTVALLDLDDFKQTNDRFGHLAGDDLLRTLTAAWTAGLSDGELLGRYGGDEFVILFTRTDSATARDCLARLRDVHPARWTAGVATATVDDDLLTLLDRADLDLHAAKSHRPDRF